MALLLLLAMVRLGPSLKEQRPRVWGRALEGPLQIDRGWACDSELRARWIAVRRRRSRSQPSRLAISARSHNIDSLAGRGHRVRTVVPLAQKDRKSRQTSVFLQQCSGTPNPIANALLLNTRYHPV